MQTYFKLFNNVVKTMIWTLAKFWEDLCVITLKHTVRKTYLRNNGALMQTFSFPCFSSSNRVGGVAHDCVKTASKLLFPWLQSPLCCNQVFFSHPEWVATQFQGKLSKRRTRNRHPVGSRGCDANKEQSVLIHLFNSGLYSTWWSFYSRLRLSYFPFAFRLILFRELTRTFAKTK